MNYIKLVVSFSLAIYLLASSTCIDPPLDRLCFNSLLDEGEDGIDCGGPCKDCRPVIPFKELVIIDTSVVNHQAALTGRLSFKHLIENMTNDTISSKELVLSFFKSWQQEQQINTFKVPARKRIKDSILEPWKIADGQPGVSDDDWNMNLDNAPIRLLAIVNRMDLQRLNDDGSIKNAGEGRFVFCTLNERRDPMQFTIIFEYELPARDSLQVFEWASMWHDLGAHDSFDSSYVADLISLTDGFVSKNRTPNKPNGNAINQIRTNEIAIGAPWELREFNISSNNGLFKEVPRKMTPDFSFNNSNTLSNFIIENTESIRNGEFTIDSLFAGKPFLGGNCPTPFGFKWSAPRVEQELVDLFSIETCNGCHAGNTGTAFTHINPREASRPAGLSDFVKDKEIPIRAQIFQKGFLGIQDVITMRDTNITFSMPILIEDELKKRRNRSH